ncbi:MAG: carboxypeptidase regulatory-like domain-containing protein [Chloroflexi bacterium]|nr:carboxypeptidase regulatory-like domain-containing protein [Chloroflexota bacterium]
MKKRALRGLLLMLPFLVVVWISRLNTETTGDIRGVVSDGTHPLANVSVRVKTTKTQTITDAQGAFVLRDVNARGAARVTAWLDGYYIGGTDATPGESNALIVLKSYLAQDTDGYKWIAPSVERAAWDEFLISAGLGIAARLSFDDAFLPLAGQLTLGCRDCHGEIIFKQWAGGAHARGASNIRFRTLYNGTDVEGNKSPLTRFASHQDYGRIPLLPDPNQPYFGPGFKLDFPDSAGNCAACHLPSAALVAPYGTDPNQVKGVEAQGAHCDFCHKVADVKLNPATGLPYENMPGVLSLVLRRPAPEPQLFFGPYDDVDVGPDTNSPLQRKSEYCAPCHNASFWGTPIYQSFAEWKASPYSDPRTGKTCQDCHMKPDGIATNFAPGRGGLERDPAEIFTHTFPGVDEHLLQNTATLKLDARQDGDKIRVEVRVTNSEAGHHIPTDHPMRNMILLVKATDAQGREMNLREGSVAPEWGGKGNAPNDYAGKPGKGYAKILENLWTEDSPAVSYWRQTVLRADTRIPALATDVSSYTFVAPRQGSAKIEATLIFRRAFKTLAEQKGWEFKEIVMEKESVVLEPK